MVTWTEFAAAAPELAEAGRSLLNQFRVALAFLATVRKDGAPRLHPVCPVLSNDRLFVFITPTSPKRHDLLRDGRYALQTFPQPKPGSDEFYATGKARLVDDPAMRAAVLRDAKHIADESEIAFELWIDRVMHTRWENVLTPPDAALAPEVACTVVADRIGTPVRSSDAWLSWRCRPTPSRNDPARKRSGAGRVARACRPVRAIRASESSSRTGS